MIASLYQNGSVALAGFFTLYVLRKSFQRVTRWGPPAEAVTRANTIEFCWAKFEETLWVLKMQKPELRVTCGREKAGLGREFVGMLFL